MTGYGYSASRESNYSRFGLDAESIVEKCLRYLNKIGKANGRTFG
jgi:pyruvate dehydrogenase complex dehydrogenase (E1) component